MSLNKSAHTGSHLHITLQQIDDLANTDVEMQAPIEEYAAFMVVDTNILLHHFEVLSQLVEDVKRLGLPLIVVIPGAVIYELDGQKNRDGLAWFARRASAWLLGKVRERKAVKVQANEETCKASGNWKTKESNFSSERINDSLILDCCRYYRRIRPVWLCSADKNLCIEGVSENIQTITPSRSWSSREIVQSIYDTTPLSYSAGRTSGYRDSYQYPLNAPATPAAVDGDSMMVDDEGPAPAPVEPSHALDLLHLQVIDHFTRVLLELVGRVGGREVHERKIAKGGTSASRYAPRWQQKMQLSTWDASDCLEYLCGKKPVKTTNPRVEIFLSKPYSTPGARRGQDWSRKDWAVALGNLALVGEAWGDNSIRESLVELEPHWSSIFALKMRPTGL